MRHEDIAVVGAGAAGLMAAITAKKLGADVLLLNGKEKIGAKILMSGGTRCNITNDAVVVRDFQTETPRVVDALLRSFSSEDAIQFFQNLGLSLVLEEGGKYFPSTHSGRTVLEVFLKEIERLEIPLKAAHKVNRVDFQNGLFTLSGDAFSYQAKAVILTTGGLSFPATGSDGSGYSIAGSFGHTLIETTPSLTPLQTDDPDWKKLSGIALPVKLTLWTGNKKDAQYEGSFLFTHFGFSGPVVLNISRHWIRRPKNQVVKIAADFLPQVSEENLRTKIMATVKKNPSLQLKTFLAGQIPARLTEVILEKQSIDAELVLNQLSREARENLIRFLKSCPLSVTGDLGYAKAEVTAGGVPLSEVNPRTLESKKQPGLFFAGEILDVDGRIGGFNFQWAWTSGYAAANGAVSKCC